MRTPLESVTYRLERANKQRRDLETAVMEFGAAQPYLIGRQKDEQTGNTLFYLAQAAETPDSVSDLLGDWLHLTRTVLDHLLFQIFLIRRTNSSDEGGSIDFPIFDPAKKSEAQAFRPIKSLGQDVIKALSAVKPYKGGNDLFWILHRLDNIDKHRRIVTTCLCHNSIKPARAVQQLLISKGLGDMAPFFSKDVSIATPRTGKIAEVGEVLFVGKPEDDEVNEHLKFTFDVALNEPGVVEGKSLLGTIEGIGHLVQNIVADFTPFF